MHVVLAHVSALQAIQHLAVEGVRPTVPTKTPGATCLLPHKPRLSELAGINRAQFGIGARLHIAVRSRQDAIRIRGVASHVISAELPTWALLKLETGIYCVHPAIIAAELAPAMDRIERISFLYELCGAYATSVKGENGYAAIAPLAAMRDLAFACAHLPGLRGAALVRDALRFAADNAASPAEAEIALRYGLPRRLGGYAFGTPLLNCDVAASELRYENGEPVSSDHTRKPDLFWPKLGIALDYHGERSHSSFRQIDRDLRRSNELLSSGFTCFTLTRYQARDCRAADRLALQMQKAAFGRTRRFAPEFYDARLDLAARLIQIRKRNWQRLE